MNKPTTTVLEITDKYELIKVQLYEDAKNIEVRNEQNLRKDKEETHIFYISESNEHPNCVFAVDYETLDYKIEGSTVLLQKPIQK